VRVGWSLWVLTNKGIKVWAAESSVDDLKRRLADAIKQGEELEKERRRLTEEKKAEAEAAKAKYR
jgi:hypothetical protein